MFFVYAVLDLPLSLPSCFGVSRGSFPFERLVGYSPKFTKVSVEESCEKLKAAADRQKSILLELVSRLQSSVPKIPKNLKM